jgi:enterochelin esterase-like enzyme
MSLDSWSTELLVLLVLAAVVGLSIWGWRRFRFRRTFRFASLLVTQVLALVAILVPVNISGQFFGDWQDITGSTAGLVASNVVSHEGEAPGSAVITPSTVPSESGDLRSRARPASTPPGAGPAAPSAAPSGATAGSSAIAPGPGDPPASSGPGDWRTTALERDQDRVEARKSRVVDIVVHGQMTGYNEVASVYLPGSYAIDPNRRYPLLQLQAGYPGNHQTWIKYLKIKQMLDDLIASGKLPALIAVMADQNPVHDRDSECVDADPSLMPGSLADTFLSSDVPTYIRAHFRAGTGRDDLVIGGYSTGGFCAANLALRHPDTYGGVIVLSGYFSANTDGTTGRLYRDHEQRDANSPLVTVHQPHPPIAFFLGAAANASDDMEGLTSMADAIPQSDPLDVMTTPTGGHSGRSWKVLMPQALIWMASELAR